MPAQVWEFVSRFWLLLGLQQPPSLGDVLAMVLLPPASATDSANGGLGVPGSCSSAALHCALVRLTVGETFSLLSAFLGEKGLVNKRDLAACQPAVTARTWPEAARRYLAASATGTYLGLTALPPEDILPQGTVHDVHVVAGRALLFACTVCQCVQMRDAWILLTVCMPCMPSHVWYTVAIVQRRCSACCRGADFPCVMPCTKFVSCQPLVGVCVRLVMAPHCAIHYTGPGAPTAAGAVPGAAPAAHNLSGPLVYLGTTAWLSYLCGGLNARGVRGAGGGKLAEEVEGVAGGELMSRVALLPPQSSRCGPGAAAVTCDVMCLHVGAACWGRWCCVPVWARCATALRSCKFMVVFVLTNGSQLVNFMSPPSCLLMSPVFPVPCMST